MHTVAIPLSTYRISYFTRLPCCGHSLVSWGVASSPPFCRLIPGWLCSAFLMMMKDGAQMEESKCHDRNHFAIILRYNHRAASSHRNLPQHRPQHRDPRFHYQSSEGERCLLQIWLHFQRHNFHGCKKVSCTVMILEPRGSRIITSKKVLYYWELRFACMSLLTYFRVLMLPAGRNCYWKLSVELIVILSAELYFTLSWLFQ